MFRISCIKKRKSHLKILCIGLVIVLTLSLCACSSNESGQSEYENQKNQDVLLSNDNEQSKYKNQDVLLFDDDFVTVYYRNCEQDDNKEKIVFYIENKYTKALALVVSSLALDGENVDVGWNEFVAASSRGEIDIPVDRDSYLPTLNPKTITISCRVIEENTWDTITQFSLVNYDLGSDIENTNDIVISVSETYKAFEDACSISIDDLDETNSFGFTSYTYNGLLLDTEEIEEHKSYDWLDGVNLNQGMLYDSLARTITEYNEIYPDGYVSAYGLDFWDVYGDVCTILWGISKTNDSSVLTQNFIDSEKLFVMDSENIPFIEIMRIFSNCDTISGIFSSATKWVDGEKYSFEIPDLTATAKELGITETALGYVLAKLNEYTDNIIFDGNSVTCSLEVKTFS